jgi:hypothetical protein
MSSRRSSPTITWIVVRSYRPLFRSSRMVCEVSLLIAANSFYSIVLTYSCSYRFSRSLDSLPLAPGASSSPMKNSLLMKSTGIFYRFCVIAPSSVMYSSRRGSVLWCVTRYRISLCASGKPCSHPATASASETCAFYCNREAFTSRFRSATARFRRRSAKLVLFTRFAPLRPRAYFGYACTWDAELIDFVGDAKLKSETTSDDPEH